MAASSEDKDYVHLIVAHLEKTQKNKPEVMVRNVADFERNYANFDIAGKFKEAIAFDADLVIIAIGENAAEPANAEGATEFSSAVEKLIQAFQRPQPKTTKIIVRTSFWPNKVKDEAMKQASQRTHSITVDLASFAGDASLEARSERPIDHAGVAAHPGDKGMKAIADAILKSIVHNDEPQVETSHIRLVPFATEPEIVTPVSCVFDALGDFYVIESNTHFRPDNYPGPKFDRVYRYAAADLQKPDRKPEVFLENTTYTMQICAGPEDWIYVSTRREVRRYHSRGTLPKGEGELVLKLDTKGDYPHNGLSGMAIGPDGKLYIGMGENLGEPYVLLNPHGETIRGGGEGGNLFRCELDGKHVERIATGFWNPFGLSFDEQGRLWVVDNDPDASPPCRLLHVVPGGDYGFEFQFGRAGTNPLIAWRGQLPGTLGFAAGTGESPCAIVVHQGFLWVTSWGDNRVERFQIHHAMNSDNAILLGEPEVVIQGGPSFRPVGMALAPNGSIYFTDWVDRSYTLHRLGKIWRMDLDTNLPRGTIPPRSNTEALAAQASGGDALWSDFQSKNIAPNSATLRQVMESKDPFVQTAAMWNLVHSKEIDSVEWISQSDRSRATLAMAYRWRDLNQSSPWSKEKRRDFFAQGLSDESSEVRMIVLRWIAEVKETELRSAIDLLLGKEKLSDQEYRLALATLDFLERGMADRSEIGGHRVALAIAKDEKRPESLRTTALSLLRPNEPGLQTEDLLRLARSKGRLSREATRMLALRSDAPSRKGLANLVDDNKLEGQLRADAMMGLAMEADQHKELLQRLAQETNRPVQLEAQRILSRLAKKDFSAGRPKDEDTESWLKRLANLQGDPEAGWRVFFRSGSGQCSACHSFRDRGAVVGPDLSTLHDANQGDSSVLRKRILESMLQPSREIGPLYVPWMIKTKDGDILTGIKLHTPGAGGKTRYLSNQGEFFDVDLNDIDEQKMVRQSIMPTGLLGSMDDNEIADLLALLIEPSH